MRIEEVAKLAQVSTATVSRVLNNEPIVKDATRERVMKVVEELNFHPNMMARSLAGGRNRNIGLIVSDIQNPFFLDIYKSLEKEARAQGYEVIVANTHNCRDQLASSLRLMAGQRVAGLAAIISEMEPSLVDELRAYGIPVVLYDVTAQRRNISNVRVNYKEGMEHLAACLYRLGHRRWALAGNQGAPMQTMARVEAALHAVSGYPDVTIRTESGADTLEGGRQAASALFSSGPPFTALLCMSDLMALGALREIRERGMRIPHDISVTGFDDIELAQYSCPPLTSVRVPREQIGQRIWEVLDPSSRMQVENRIFVVPELVVRGSIGPAPRA